MFICHTNTLLNVNREHYYYYFIILIANGNINANKKYSICTSISKEDKLYMKDSSCLLSCLSTDEPGEVSPIVPPSPSHSGIHGRSFGPSSCITSCFGIPPSLILQRHGAHSLPFFVGNLMIACYFLMSQCANIRCYCLASLDGGQVGLVDQISMGHILYWLKGVCRPTVRPVGLFQG